MLRKQSSTAREIAANLMRSVLAVALLGVLYPFVVTTIVHAAR